MRIGLHGSAANGVQIVFLLGHEPSLLLVLVGTVG